ncbi:Re/Si-specific NAD(P)(+) transhydrogenase subunit alpha [Nocardia abscessus]|uniref:Re/Si-specific NAD(P)(+) transhydrogenase subunit alpha n=1 Tax=Nocardia abscessus TaxID=120957 RepID=UPI002B4B2F2D|nr:Re/Si-specific NAD(P)(+) transhydrogenase subunit alpha [Nocardia abscessus]
METTQSVGDPSPRGARVGVVRESNAGERRVALVPKIIPSLVKQGVDVVVEAGAGQGALIPDEAYVEAGASIGDPWSADVVVKVAPPSDAEVGKLSSGQTLIGFLAPRNAENQIGALKSAGVQAFAVEAIPRISRAQVMDALSSQANVAGYKAVLLAASESTRFFPMLTTAAGTVKPATVLVLGVGVAGLQALATAKRLGGRTTGYDVRPEVADQVRSVGAQWLDLGIDAAGEGGYARELTDEEKAKQQQALEDAIKGFDVVITTALVPGRPAPRLVTAAAVEGMKPGSVIVDLAGETGGNCELTEPGQTVVKHEVTIASPLNLPATMPEHASELYSKNIAALLELMLVDGKLAPDFSDQVLADSCVTRDAADAPETAGSAEATESADATGSAEATESAESTGSVDATESVESAEVQDATEAKVEN